MSILIKGMEMPTSCRECRFDNTGWCLATDRAENRTRFVKFATYDSPQEWCPLVPVPPHGRLIDADALLNWARERDDGGPINWVDSLDLKIWAGKHTIIPANEGADTDFWGEEYAEAKGLAEEGE